MNRPYEAVPTFHLETIQEALAALYEAEKQKLEPKPKTKKRWWNRSTDHGEPQSGRAVLSKYYAIQPLVIKLDAINNAIAEELSQRRIQPR